MIRVYDYSMFEILNLCEEAIEGVDEGGLLSIEIPNPNLNSSHSWRSWSDLATLLQCRMLTPIVVSDTIVILKYQKLNRSNSFHSVSSSSEKYGVESIFATIDKNEEVAFLYSYRHSLMRVDISNRARVLDLGVNSGGEFEIIKKMVDEESYRDMELVGVDYSMSAIESAKERFGEPNVSFYCHDINELSSLKLEPFDLIISIGTLQSPNIPFKTLFMSLIQNHLNHTGAIILGFPNSRWIDGEMIYGAKAPNYPFSEMSLLIKDIHFCKKYLQQHRFRVTITGKDYLFLSATRIGV